MNVYISDVEVDGNRNISGGSDLEETLSRIETERHHPYNLEDVLLIMLEEINRLDAEVETLRAKVSALENKDTRLR